MGARCTKQNRGLKASTTFHNVHCVGRWVQRNILGLDHPTSFNRPMLQSIHSLMNKQHTVYLNMVILHSLITNSQHIKGAKYSHLVLVTRSCRNFLPDEVFSAYNRVFVAPERITSMYNNCLHAIWTPTIQPEDIPAESSSKKQLEDEDEPTFGISCHPLIHVPSCLPFIKAWRRFSRNKLGFDNKWRSNLHS